MARTTHRSKTGRKLYAKRSKTGTFDDVQSYKRAHGSDVKRSSAAERAQGCEEENKQEEEREEEGNEEASCEEEVASDHGQHR